MPNNHRLAFRLRLEDAVALCFFLLSLALRVFVRGVERRNLSPADVLIIIPAVTLLLAKELIHYFLAGPKESGGDPRAFIRPFWEIVRDWFPFR